MTASRSFCQACRAEDECLDAGRRHEASQFWAVSPRLVSWWSASCCCACSSQVCNTPARCRLPSGVQCRSSPVAERRRRRSSTRAAARHAAGTAFHVLPLGTGTKDGIRVLTHCIMYPLGATTTSAPSFPLFPCRFRARPHLLSVHAPSSICHSTRGRSRAAKKPAR